MLPIILVWIFSIDIVISVVVIVMNSDSLLYRVIQIVGMAIVIERLSYFQIDFNNINSTFLAHATTFNSKHPTRHTHTRTYSSVRVRRGRGGYGMRFNVCVYTR